jgi:primosomal protein N' (replication factor Y)
VRVPFAGRDMDGFVVDRPARAEHAGRLSPIRRSWGPSPCSPPELLATARAVADRYGGVLGDVLRLAVPKRHAAAERALPEAGPQLPRLTPPPPGPWAAYAAGEAFLRRVAAGEGPAASWLALPGRPEATDWPRALAVAAATTLAAGRGAVLVVPDHRDVERVDDQGPQARYTAWLKLLRGHVHCVVGTRAAAFAPVRDPGLLAWWDDGDDLHDEPRGRPIRTCARCSPCGPAPAGPRCSRAGSPDRSPSRSGCSRGAWPRCGPSRPPSGARSPGSR